MKIQFHFRLILMLAMVVFVSPIIRSQSQSMIQPFRIKSDVSLKQQEQLSASVDRFVLLTMNETVARQILEQKEASVTMEIPLPAGGQAILSLRRFEILTPDAKTVAGTASGDVEIPLSRQFVAYSGQVVGEEGSLAVLTVSARGIYGWITLNREQYVLASLGRSQSFRQEDYILYPTSRVLLNRNFFCASEVMEIPQQIQELMATLEPETVSPRTSDLLEVEVALESDYETYQDFGSVEAATDYLLSLIATVSAGYIRDLNVRFVVTYTRVWDDPNDPYNGTDSGTLLNQFRTYWNSNMRFVNRDLAHYISTRPGGMGGIAWLDVLCSNTINGYGYAFSNTNGSFNDLPTYSWDVDVVSHETGHNFGSPHTHNCSWNPPIDTCWVSSENSDCVNSPPVPRVGTIMSYCHLTASKVLEFHPLVIALMRTRADQAQCVESSPVSMLLVKPVGGENFISFQDVSIIWGSSGATTVDLQYSPDSGATWVDIAANVDADAREFVWTVPYISQTHNALLRIFNSADSTQADTTDATFRISPMLFTFELLSPPHLSSITVAPGDTTPVQFVWSSAGSLPEISYDMSFSYQANTMDIPSDQAGQDTVLTLTAHQVDSILASWNAWNGNDSVRVRWYSTAYLNNSSSRSSNLHFVFFKRDVTGIASKSDAGIPKAFALHQNYPNPFNPNTTIAFELPYASRITLHVYDVSGRKVRTLVSGQLSAGNYQVRWDGRDDKGKPVSSGVYLYRLTAGKQFVQTRKLLLLQ